MTDETLSFLSSLSAHYPGFEQWYQGKVLPGVADETRRVFVRREGDRIIGVGIAKRTDEERKVCTLRISPRYQGRGIGVRMFEEMLAWLGTQTPVATVSDQSLPQFQTIFDRYRFIKTSEHRGLYLPTRTEVFFNEAAA